MLEITLNDDDLDQGVPQVDEAMGEDGESYEIPAGAIAASEAVRFRTSMGEILDADDSLAVDYRDVVLTVDTSGSPNETTTAAILAAWGDLTRQSDAGDHPFSLENPQGGAFILSSETPVTVPEGGITFTVTYTTHDVQTHTIPVRSTQDPTGISVTLTETGRSTGRFTGSFTVDTATDDDSNTIAAIDGSLISVTYDDGGTNREAKATVETTEPSIALVAPSDGTSTQVLTPRLIAQVSDADSGIDEGSITFNVDAPATTTDVTTVPLLGGGYRAEVQMEGVSAGETDLNWSVTVSDNAGNSATSVSNSIRIDTVAPNVDSAKTVDPTSISVEFNENLNGDSLQASDFRVNGVAPADVSSEDSTVSLTVPAMAANAKPVVEVVGNVEDTAGNVLPGGQQVTAADGIAPTLEILVAPDFSTGEVMIDVRTDETLLTVPSVTVGGDSVSNLRRAGDNHFQADFTASSSGVYSVKAEGRDTSANPGDASADFEIDNALPMPTSVTFPGMDPVMDLSASGIAITTQNPFITIEWDSEASEYDGDSHASVTVTGLMITDADGGEIDVKVSSPSSNRLLISARDLALGTYAMSFNGEDDIGNTLASDVSLPFEVKEPDPFEIMLTPGWNLVSLPAEPQMSAINDVIPEGHPASIVLTYDPTQPGAWLSASRGDDGMFAGSLENIGARTAYWVFTDAFDSLEVEVMLQRGGSPSHLPTINLVAGWNLLPVLDVTGGASFGDSASNHVGGVLRTYSYDSSGDRFDQHDGMLQVGHGYWAYLSGTTVLLP